MRLNCWIIHIFSSTRLASFAMRTSSLRSSGLNAFVSKASTFSAPTVRFPSLKGAAISQRILSSNLKYLSSTETSGQSKGSPCMATHPVTPTPLGSSKPLLDLDNPRSTSMTNLSESAFNKLIDALLAPNVFITSSKIPSNANKGFFSFPASVLIR